MSENLGNVLQKHKNISKCRRMINGKKTLFPTQIWGN